MWAVQTALEPQSPLVPRSSICQLSLSATGLSVCLQLSEREGFTSTATRRHLAQSLPSQQGVSLSSVRECPELKVWEPFTVL